MSSLATPKMASLSKELELALTQKADEADKLIAELTQRIGALEGANPASAGCAAV